jgi:tRNA1Val (adenine37-N6)-methyltransferase
MSKTFDFQQFTLVCPDNGVHAMGTDSWLLGASSNIPAHSKNILDIGTGSGVVALMIAQRTALMHSPPDVHAIDIDKQAVILAENNFQDSPWASRMKAILGDLNDYESRTKYDLIVCNPPYFLESTTSPSKARHRARHERNLPINALVKAANSLLANDGIFCLIAPLDYGKQLEEYATCTKLYCNKITDIYANKENSKPIRWLMQFSHDPFPFERDELTIAASQHEYTAPVKALLGTFFTHL